MTLKYKESRGLSLWLAFGIPVGLMLVVMLIAGSEPFRGGEVSMLYSDMYHQYFPFWVEFGRAIRNGEGLLWNWATGMGMDYLSLISYYLASPLNLISAIVPESLALEVYSLLMPIKLGLASLFFAIFLNKIFEKEDISISLFGSMYALCGWALAYQWNVMWLDTFALLPLTVLGMVYLLRDKKPLLYTFTLFLSIFSNYYIGFFTCIFILLLFFVYEISRWRGFKRLLADFVRIGWFTVLAIGMTCILTLPALNGLQSTQSSVNKFPEGFKLNIADENTWAGLFDAMRQVAGNTLGGIVPSFKEGLPNLYCGVGSILLAVLFLTCKEVKWRDKLFSLALLIFFMVSFIVRQLDYIWHGFHFTNMIPYRFSFLFSFVMLYMAYKAFLVRRKFRLWQMIPAAMLTVCIFLCSDSYSDPVFIAYNAIFLVLYLGVYIFRRVELRMPPREDREALVDYFAARRSRRAWASRILAGVMCLELVINLVNFGVRFPYTGISNYPKGTTYTASMIRYMKEDDDLFYRAEVTHSQTLNDSALNGYNGISTFTSSANVNVTNYLKMLGYAAKDTYNRYCFEEGSPVSNLFLNLKYMLERDGQVEENSYFDQVWHYGDVYLLENNAYLPLGFLAESSLGDFEFAAATNSFTFQNRLFTAATGIEEAVWNTASGKQLTIEENGTNLIGQSSGGYCSYKNDASQTTLVFRYDFTDAGFFCVDMNLSARNSFTVWKNGIQLFSESISLPQTMAISEVVPGDNIEIKLTCKANESGTITIRGGLLKDEVFRQGCDILAASTLELTEFSNTSITGTIDCNRSGLLYTSVPQNGENWSVTVDGEEAEIVLVGGAMIGIALTEGHHEIQLTYTNSAYKLGLVVSLVCLVIFLGIIAEVYGPKLTQITRRKKRK